MQSPKSRLRVDPITGEPVWGVGAGTVGTFLKAYYPQAQHLIRIASAYFTVEGYNIGRSFLPANHHVKFRILVGSNEGDRPQLAILNEVENELKSCKGVYYPAVRELIRRIDNKEFIILDAREMEEKYHCKFYVCDDQVLVHGSGNYTGYGLRSQHEQASANRNSDAINDLTDWFEEASASAKDLTLPLVEVLRNWLKLGRPFHAYLKFLAALDLFFDRKNVPGLLLPVYYQQRMIARAIDHIREHRAAIILAATGLGKTIIGPELAFQLKCLQLGAKVILIAPSGVHAEWKRHLKVRGFEVEAINTDLLFKGQSDHAWHKVNKLDKLLKEADDQTIILIDEAHAYRNQLRAYWQKHVKKYKDEKKREELRGSVAVDRVRPVVDYQKAIVVLLTATPYGTNPKNTESLLEFLPSATKEQSKKESQKSLTLDEFAGLPFVSSLGITQVLRLAREREDILDGRTFVQFGDHRRYLPQTVHLCRVNYQLPLYTELCAAFERGMFAQENPNPSDTYIEEKEGFGTKVVDNANGQFIHAWLGSPQALSECIIKNLYTLSERDRLRYANLNIEVFPTREELKLGYQTSMKMDWSVRKEHLHRLKDKLKNKPGDKVVRLLDLLNRHVIERREKVIVFVERHATAIFVEEYLRKVGSKELHIGCTIERTNKGGCSIKGEGPRNQLIDNFSPKSRNAVKVTFPVNVLICTDANGIGINLQDANVVVNYDPADSADILFQRAGRIIRFTDDPHRNIYLYTFQPAVDPADQSKACRKITHVFENMRKHHGRSRSTFGLSILPEGDNEIIDLNDPKQEADFVGSFNVAQDSSSTDPLFHHTAVFDKHRSEIKEIKDGFYCARVYKESQPRIAVLVQEGSRKHILFYNLSTKKFEHANNYLPIIEQIACSPKTENAPIAFETIEQATRRVVKQWHSQQTTIGETSLICAMYLAPKSKKTFARELLIALVQKRKKRSDKVRNRKVRK